MKRWIYYCLLYSMALSVVAQPPLLLDAQPVPALTGDESTSLYFRTPYFFTYNRHRIQVVKREHLDSSAQRVRNPDDLKQSLRYGYYCVRYTDTGKPYLTYRPWLLGGTPGGMIGGAVTYCANIVLNVFSDAMIKSAAKALGIDPESVDPLMMSLYNAGTAVGAYMPRILANIDFAKQFRALRGNFAQYLPGNLQKISPQDVLLMTLLPGDDKTSDQAKRFFAILRNIYYNDPQLAASLIGAPTPETLPDTFVEFLLSFKEVKNNQPGGFEGFSSVFDSMLTGAKTGQTFLVAPEIRKEVLGAYTPSEQKKSGVSLDVINNITNTGSPIAPQQKLPVAPKNNLSVSQKSAISQWFDSIRGIKEEPENHLLQSEDFRKIVDQIPKEADRNAKLYISSEDPVPCLSSYAFTKNGIKKVREQIPVIEKPPRTFNDEKPEAPWRLYCDDRLDEYSSAESPLFYRPMSPEEDTFLHERRMKAENHIDVLKDALVCKQRPEPEVFKKTVWTGRYKHKPGKYVTYKNYKGPKTEPLSAQPVQQSAPVQEGSSQASYNPIPLSNTHNEEVSVDSYSPVSINEESVKGRNSLIDLHHDLAENKRSLHHNRPMRMYVAEYRPDLDKSGQYLDIYQRMVAESIARDIDIAQKDFLTSLNLAKISQVFKYHKIDKKLENIKDDYEYLTSVCNTLESSIQKEFDERMSAALESTIGPKQEKFICDALENDTPIPLTVHGTMEDPDVNYTAIKNCDSALDYLEYFRAQIQEYADNPVVMQALRGITSLAIRQIIKQQKWELNGKNAFYIFGVGLAFGALKSYGVDYLARSAGWLAQAGTDKFVHYASEIFKFFGK